MCWHSPCLCLAAYFCFLLTALGVTAGAHRLWSHRSYKAKLPLRIFLAVANSMAFQVGTECTFLHTRSRLGAQAPGTPCLSQVVCPCSFIYCKLSLGDFVAKDMLTTEEERRFPLQSSCPQDALGPSTVSSSDESWGPCWVCVGVSHLILAVAPVR